MLRNYKIHEGDAQSFIADGDDDIVIFHVPLVERRYIAVFISHVNRATGLDQKFEEITLLSTSSYAVEEQYVGMLEANNAMFKISENCELYTIRGTHKFIVPMARAVTSIHYMYKD